MQPALSKPVLQLHWFIGVAALLGFIIQGQFMAHSLDGLQGMEDGPRMLYRSAHIYTLLAAAINLAISFANFNLGKSRYLAWLASVLALQGPLFIGASFLLESNLADLQRPVLSLSLYGLFGACALWALIGFKVQFRRC